MDGVLVDTTKIHEKAFQQVLEKYRANFQIDYKKYAGMKTFDAFQSAYREMGQEKSLFELKSMATEKTACSLELIKTSDVIFEGVQDLLALLKDRRKKIALASSASKVTVDLLAEKYQFQNYFECILSASDVAEAKPSPQIFVNCLKHFEVSPSEALVVEDSVAGIEASNRAQIDSVAVSTTVSEIALKATTAKIILPLAKDLMAYL